MSTPVRLAAFAAALVAVFAAALGVGRLVGPVSTEPAAAHGDDQTHGDQDGHGSNEESSGAEASGHGEHTGGDAAESASPAHLPGGLMVSDQGHTLHLTQTRLPAGRAVPLSFHVLDAAGEPVTAYDEVHEKQLHLIAVRRDFRGFQHLHPTLAADGTWTTDLELDPGTWRVFADFTPTGGPALTLGADLEVAGADRPAPVRPVTTTDTVDGYTVDLTGSLAPGETTMLDLEVTRDGEPVTDLEPYLGAYGHLVSLREGDLAYLHVHPLDGETGPSVLFETQAPSAGRYHLYLDFKHDGVVRTASFVLDTDQPAGHDHGSHDHGDEGGNGGSDEHEGSSDGHDH